MINDIGIYRRGFNVIRYHTKGSGMETVGHHTAGVIAILFMLEDNPRVELIRAALEHDLPEQVVGDIPAPAKRAYPELKAASDKAEKQFAEEAGMQDESVLTDKEKALLKFADYLDLCIKCIEEIGRGNGDFVQTLANGVRYCKALLNNELKAVPNPHELFAVLLSNNIVEVIVNDEEAQAAASGLKH